MRFLNLIPLLIILAGCANQAPYMLNLMPVPDFYFYSKMDPFTEIEPIEETPYQGILYATDRLPADEKNRSEFYLNQRGHLLRLGVANVRALQDDISLYELVKVSLEKNRKVDYPLIVTEVEEYGVLHDSVSIFTDQGTLDGDPLQPGREFADEVNARMRDSGQQDIYLYIHGYKVVFENPLLVATELWHFLGYEGAFIAYAWPATPNKWAYFSDIESADYTAHNLRILLKFLARETQAERIHIIGYSAGTRVVTEALRQITLENKHLTRDQILQKSKLGHVILVGSDYDPHIFASYIADGLLDVMQDLSIYVSGMDKALDLSQWLTKRKRLGQIVIDGQIPGTVIQYLQENPNLSLIDVTDAQGATIGNGHHYFRKSPWVSSDIILTLTYNLKPQNRGLIRGDCFPIWTFPENYTELLSIEQHSGAEGE